MLMLRRACGAGNLQSKNVPCARGWGSSQDDSGNGGPGPEGGYMARGLCEATMRRDKAFQVRACLHVHVCNTTCAACQAGTALHAGHCGSNLSESPHKLQSHESAIPFVINFIHYIRLQLPNEMFLLHVHLCFVCSRISTCAYSVWSQVRAPLCILYAGALSGLYNVNSLLSIMHKGCAYPSAKLCLS